MKIYSKALVGRNEYPFEQVLTLRASVETDTKNNIFYVKADSTQNSWGIAFVTKNGYTAEKPNVEGLSTGTKSGIDYWVSARGRTATHDYCFDVKKGNTVTKSYRIIYII